MGRGERPQSLSIPFVRRKEPLNDSSIAAFRPLLAVSGNQNLVFPAFLTAALPAKAAIGLIRWRGAANDPKRTFAIERTARDVILHFSD